MALAPPLSINIHLVLMLFSQEPVSTHGEEGAVMPALCAEPFTSKDKVQCQEYGFCLLHREIHQWRWGCILWAPAPFPGALSPCCQGLPHHPWGPHPHCKGGTPRWDMKLIGQVILQASQEGFAQEQGEGISL